MATLTKYHLIVVDDAALVANESFDSRIERRAFLQDLLYSNYPFLPEPEEYLDRLPGDPDEDPDETIRAIEQEVQSEGSVDVHLDTREEEIILAEEIHSLVVDRGDGTVSIDHYLDRAARINALIQRIRDLGGQVVSHVPITEEVLARILQEQYAATSGRVHLLTSTLQPDGSHSNQG